MQVVLTIIFAAVAFALQGLFGMGFFESLFWTIPTVIGLAIVAGIIGIPLLMARANDNARLEEAYREGLKHRASDAIEAHVTTLLRKKRISMVVDDYGISDDRKWQREIDYFFESVLSPEISLPSDDQVLREQRKAFIVSEVLLPILEMEEEKQAEQFADRFDPTMSPIEYEHFCAARLRKSGWHATVTQASGDQGADIIAIRSGITLVIQCKHHSKPVGNKSVQEIVAAREHYGASHGIVVATNGYTKAARALAATNRITLLDHDDLSSNLTI